MTVSTKLQQDINKFCTCNFRHSKFYCITLYNGTCDLAKVAMPQHVSDTFSCCQLPVIKTPTLSLVKHHTMQGHGVAEAHLHAFVNLVLEQIVWSASSHSCLLLWVGSRAVLDGMEKRKSTISQLSSVQRHMQKFPNSSTELNMTSKISFCPQVLQYHFLGQPNEFCNQHPLHYFSTNVHQVLFHTQGKCIEKEGDAPSVNYHNAETKLQSSQ